MTIHSETHCLCGGRERHRGWCPSHPVQLARREAGLPPSLRWPGVHVPSCSHQFRADLRLAYPDQRETVTVEDEGTRVLNALGRLESSSLGSAIAHLESVTWGWSATPQQVQRAERIFGPVVGYSDREGVS